MSRVISRKTFLIAVVAFVFSIWVCPAVKAYAADEGGLDAQEAGEAALDTLISIVSQGNELTDSAKQADIDILMAATKKVLADSFGESYTVEQVDNIIKINIWADGIAYASVYAAKDQGYKQDWDSLLNSLQGMSETIYGVYEPYGYSVSVNVLNDLNKKNVLVSYMNGVLIYDTVSSAEL